MKGRAAIGGWVMATAAALSPASAQTYLVSVGNDLGRRDEPELRYAEADADRFAEVMRQLGRVAPEHELILRGATARTFRTALLRTNAGIRRASTKAGPAPTLVVYYSGHADATGLHLGDTTMSFEELKTIVESSPAKVRVLIVDSCRSGGITQVKGVRPAEPFAIRLEDRLDVEGFAIITSSAGSEDSQESDALRASFFTHHFVNALKGAADKNQDAKVSLQEAYSYAYQETIRSSGRTLQLQHPTYAYDLKGRGDLVLTHLAEGVGRFGVLAISSPGTYLIYEGEADGLLAAEVHVEDEGARLLLSPGGYFIQRRARASYREFDITLARDETVRLRDVDYREIRYSRLLRKGGGARAAVHNLSAGTEVRGPILDGFSVTPNLLLGYAVDLAPITMGLQLRLGRSTADGVLDATASEVSLRLRADRYLDLHALSLSIGGLVEGTYVIQSFETTGSAPDRRGFAFGAGLGIGLERAFGRFVVRVEGGPMVYALSAATTSGGAVVGDETQTLVTYWFGANIGWRL